jgi:DivIVA domain-containing protein
VLTLVLYGLLAIGLMAGLFLLAARFLPAGEQIAPALRDEPPWALPEDRHLTAMDIEDLRLPVALRGYRFAETDLLLDRLVAELRRRDEELERLYGLLIAMPVPSADLRADPVAAAADAAPEQESADIDAAVIPQPDYAEPDVAEPDAAEPDVAEPDVAEPDVAEPDEPDAGAVPDGESHAGVAAESTAHSRPGPPPAERPDGLD